MVIIKKRAATWQPFVRGEIAEIGEIATIYGSKGVLSAATRLVMWRSARFLPNTQQVSWRFLQSSSCRLRETHENLSGIVPASHPRMPSASELDHMAHEIVGAGIAVHSNVGPGCFESTYTPCLASELRKRGLGYRSKVAIALQYDDITIPRAYEADFIVEGCIVVELKAIASIGRLEERQLLTYLKVGGFPLGYILNFGAPKLIDGIMRRVNNFPEGTPPFFRNSL